MIIILNLIQIGLVYQTHLQGDRTGMQMRKMTAGLMIRNLMADNTAI